MFTLPIAILSTLLATAPLQANAAYSLVKDYSGETFFNEWDFYGHYDNLTNGDANFVNQSAAGQLAYVNDAGNAIIRVSQEEVLYPNKRDTVRIQSQAAYDQGSVWVYDALHLPFGCSVWSAMWSQAVNWPSGGEIDTFEGVNLQQTNQMALHTTAGCTAVNSSSSVAFDGTLQYPNCDKDANFNSGCTATDPNPASYGEAFAAAGGGMWATEFASEGIKIWFFTRSEVPSDLSSNASSVDPTSWGTPTFYVPDSSCNIAEYFSAQHLVIDITLCGQVNEFPLKNWTEFEKTDSVAFLDASDWAGQNATLAQTGCALTTQPLCYTQYVLDAANYENAYFEIPSVRVYQDPSVSHTSTSSSDSSSNTTSSSSTNSSSSGNNNSSSTGTNGTVSRSTNILAVFATGLAAVGWALLA